MPRVTVLDTFPLTSTAKQEPRPGASLGVLANCQEGVKECIRAKNTVIAPAKLYFEALRELERLHLTSQIARLRGFCNTVPGHCCCLRGRRDAGSNG
jgi:hypothetical protein